MRYSVRGPWLLWHVVANGVVAIAAFIACVAPVAAREVVAASGYTAGTIVIHTNQRKLYLYLADGTALRYPVGVGRAGMQWSGTSYVGQVHQAGVVAAGDDQA